MMKSPSEQVDPTNLNSLNQMNPGRRMSWQGQYQVNQPPQPQHHQASDGQAPGHAQYYPEKMDLFNTPVSSYPTATTASAGVEQWQVPPSSGLGMSQFAQAESSPAHSTNSHYNMEHRERDPSNAAVNSNGMSGAAAAAAAAMVAAAHTAKGSPGYQKPQNSISPLLNAVHKPSSIPPVQRATPFHPNYANVQSGAQPQNVAPPPADPTIQNHSFSQSQGPHPMNRPPNPSQYPPQWAPPQPQPNSMDHRPSPSYQHGFEGQPLPTTERIPSYASDSISGPMSNASSHDSEDSRTKQVVSARSSSQKISALYEPEDPGRKEFIDSVLKYWEDKDLPLKHAPMMGGRTLDLYTLYQHVRSRGFFQEVTRLKLWTEISNTMGLGSTSATGFTLKKQYCKYLYGYESRTERQEPEPQEALGRVIEANRKKKQHAEQSQIKSNDHSHYGGDVPPPNMMHHQHSMPRPPHQQHHPGPPMGYHNQQPMPGYHHGYPGISHGHSVHNSIPGSYDQQPYGTMNTAWQQNPHYPPNRPMAQPRYSYRSNGIPPPQSGPPLPPPQAYPNNQTRGRPPTQPPFSQPYPSQPLPYNDMSADMKSPNYRNVTPKPLPPPNITENHPASPAVKKALAENAAVADGPPVGTTSQAMAGFNAVAASPTVISQDGSNNKISEASPSVQSSTTSAQPVLSTTLSSGKSNDKPPPIMPSTPNNAMLRSNTPKEIDAMNTSAPLVPRSDFKASPLRHGTDPHAIKRSEPGLRGPAPSQYYPGSSAPGQDSFMPGAPYHPPPRGPERPPGPGMYQPPHSYHQSYPPYGVNSQMNDSRHYGHKRLPTSMEQFGPPNKMPRPYNSQEPQPRRFGRSYRSDLGTPHHYHQSYPSSVHQMSGVRQYHPSTQHPGMPHSSRQMHLPVPRNESPAAAVTPDSHKSRPQIAHAPESASNFLKGLVGGPPQRTMAGSLHHSGSHYPPGSVEAVVAVGGKAKEKTGHEIGVIEAWQIIMSLKSGLKAESTWALNALTVLLHDGSTIGQILLSQLPGLLNLIIEHYRFCLHDLFGISDDDSLKKEENEDDTLHADAEKLASNMAVKCHTSPSTLNLGEKELKYSPAPSKLASPYCKLPVKMVAGEDSFPLLLDVLWKNEKKPAVLDFLPLSGCKGGPNRDFKSEIESHVDARATRTEMTFEDLLSIPSFVRCNAQDKVVSFNTDGKLNGNSDETSIFPEKDKKPIEKEKVVEAPDGKDGDSSGVGESANEPSNVQGKSRQPAGNASHIQSCLNRFAWSCDVALLEQEAAGFPGNLGFKAHISMNSWRIAARGLEHVFPKQPKDKDPELVTKVLCLSNIVRSLSCASANHNELCMHQNFFLSLCGTLLLGHKHRVRYVKSWDGGVAGCQYRTEEAKPQNLNGCDELSNPTGSSALSQNPTTDANEIENHSGSVEPLPNSSKCATLTQNVNSNITSVESSRKISVKQEPGTDNDEITCQNNTEPAAPCPVEKIESDLVSKASHEPITSQHNDDGTYRDPWWWDCVRQLREDSLVTLANLSTTLNLAHLPDENTVLAILDACLHWSVCPSADAQDPFPSTNPRATLSAQSLGIEILTKLSMKESNIDLILATRPYSRLEKLYKILTIMVGNRKNQTLREFSIVLLSNLCVEETAARSVALQTGAVSNFLSFLEECEETGLNNQRMFPAGQEMINCGTVSYMMQRCALTLLKLAKLEENRPLFLKHHLRILSLSMSVLLGGSVQSLISAVLFELGREPPNR